MVHREGDFGMKLQRHNILHLTPRKQVGKSKKGNQKSHAHQVPIPEKNLQELVGRLQHSAIGIPTRKWFFQLLNTALQKIPITINTCLASGLAGVDGDGNFL